MLLPEQSNVKPYKLIDLDPNVALDDGDDVEAQLTNQSSLLEGKSHLQFWPMCSRIPAAAKAPAAATNGNGGEADSGRHCLRHV